MARTNIPFLIERPCSACEFHQDTGGGKHCGQCAGCCAPSRKTKVKVWDTNYTHTRQGLPLGALLNNLDTDGHTIFQVLAVGYDEAGDRQYLVVSYKEVETQ